VLKTYQRRRSNGVHVHTRNARVLIAGTHPIEIKSLHANCMISATWLPTGRLICGSPTCNIAVQGATNTSMPILSTWQTPVVSIPAGLSIWQYDWLWRTGCHTDRHRKMQKSIYRVRTQEHISQRIAIDMQRDKQAPARLQTITMLHNKRNGIQ
jgi:hypothetical protein